MTDFKIGTAAAIHPDTGPINAPGPSLGAARTAALAHQTDPAADPFAAPMAFPIPGLTVDGLNPVAATTITFIITVTYTAVLARHARRHQSNTERQQERAIYQSRFHFFLRYLVTAALQLSWPYWPETAILLSIDLTPRTDFTTRSAFAFSSEELTVPVSVARASLTLTETEAIFGSSVSLFVAASWTVVSSSTLLALGCAGC